MQFGCPTKIQSKVRSCCKEEVLTWHIKEGVNKKKTESKRKTLECNHLGDECCNVFFIWRYLIEFRMEVRRLQVYSWKVILIPIVTLKRMIGVSNEENKENRSTGPKYCEKIESSSVLSCQHKIWKPEKQHRITESSLWKVYSRATELAFCRCLCRLWQQMQDYKKNRVSENDSEGIEWRTCYKRTTGGSGEGYLWLVFTGNVLGNILECEECGATYRRRTERGKVVYRCATRIEKGREACTESPTIGEERIKEEMGKRICGGEYDENVIRKKVDRVLVGRDGKLKILFKD